MTYHLPIDATLQSGVDDIVADQIAKAIGSLEAAGDDIEEAIHDARKRFKKLRGLARLIRPGLGDRYAEINTFFRDLGRTLSDIRDAQVLVETSEKLVAERLDDDLHTEMADAILSWAQENRERVLDNCSVGTRVDKVRDSLDDAKGNLHLWEVADEPHAVLRKGLKKTYRRGRKALAAANLDPNAERLHEWRKRVKYHWYHCRLLREAWPTVMRARADELDQLSDDLGDQHDLAVLIQTAREVGDGSIGSEHMRLIENAARSWQDDLRERAFRLGPKIYAESASDHARRIAGYWKLGRAELV